MIKTIKARHINNLEKNTSVRFTPIKKCPHCHVSTNNDDIYAIFISTGVQSFHLYVVNFCSNCEELYMVKYHGYDNGYGYFDTNSTPLKIYPYPNYSEEFSENIQNVSPRFVEIYNQSLQAENNGLLEICGIGYRKSLEFLIKDYAIRFHTDDSDKIPSMPLSQVINAYIDNKKIKSLSKASTWLGNDETHYQRKHENYNLSHLKSFIHATASFIDSDLEVYLAEELLNK